MFRIKCSVMEPERHRKRPRALSWRARTARCCCAYVVTFVGSVEQREAGPVLVFDEVGQSVDETRGVRVDVDRTRLVVRGDDQFT